MANALDIRLFTDFWHLLAHRSELAAPGDFVRLDGPLGEIVLFNDEGEVVAFDNLCPHRGARFFTEDAGSGRAICPYHGWSFRGGVVRAARAELFCAEDLQRARLNAYQLAWCGDFVFVGVSPRTTLAEQLGALWGELAPMSQDIDRRADLDDRRVQVDWRVLMENALESYHLPAVHGATLAPLALTEEQETFAGLNSVYEARIGAGRTARALEGMRRFFDVRHAHDGYRSLHVFPFAMVSSTFGLSYALQTYLPAAAMGATHFRSRLLAARSAEGGEPMTGPFLASTAQLNRRVFDEDLAICGRVSPAYDLDAPDRLFAANEARARRFAETLRQMGSAAARTAPAASVPG